MLSFIWTYLYVPETKGRTLEQMDHVFKDVVNEQEQARRKAIENEIMGNGTIRSGKV